GTIAEAGGIITAGTLGGSSIGGATLTGVNAIDTFSGFKNTGSGDVSLTNGQALAAGAITNTVGKVTLTTTAGGLTLTGDIALDSGTGILTLISAGAIDQIAGAITAGSLSGSSVGG